MSEEANKYRRAARRKERDLTISLSEKKVLCMLQKLSILMMDLALASKIGQTDLNIVKT